VPLYEYACRSCDENFEALVFSGDEVECPSCHGDDLERQWSVPAAPLNTVSPSSGCVTDSPPCGPGCCRMPPGN
jgi:putative FmdB family regulatory protein